MTTYNLKFETDVIEAIHAYNKAEYCPQLELLDACILGLVKSFQDYGASFFMSNFRIAQILLSDVASVKSSIDRLEEAGLVVRDSYWDDQGEATVRTISIDEEGLEWLKSLPSS